MSTRMITIGPVTAPFFNGTGPDFPDYELISIDDEQVKGVLLLLGVTHLFADTQPTAGKTLGDARGYIVGTHPTHWFFLERYEHWKKSSDNGYTLRGWPKSRFTKGQFGKIIEDYCAEACIGPVRFVTRDKDENKS